MSTLQISLAVIGAVLLALIVAWNAWTSHRNAPRRAERNDAPRQEPAFDGAGPLAAADPVDADGMAHAATSDEAPFAATLPGDDALALPPTSHASERRYVLDALVDAVAPLVLEHTHTGEAALAALPPTRRAGSKPFAIEGLNEVTGVWEMPATGQRYKAFQAGVQLANRTGALNEIEFSEFVAKTQAFADDMGAAPDFPDMLHEVARARELDQFASDHDAQLAFVLRARQAAWSAAVAGHSGRRAGQRRAGRGD